MLSTLSTRAFSNTSFKKFALQHTFQRTVAKVSPYKRLLFPVFSSFSYLYFTKSSRVACASNDRNQESMDKFEKRRGEINLETMSSGNRSLWETTKSIMAHLLRFFQLLAIFAPVVLLYPLRLFKYTRSLWMDIFVKSVEFAGVVWIKSFQYMSHRRDIIGPEMAEKFVHLRENAPQHSFEETEKNFKKMYGKQIKDIFEDFEKEPLASGSVSQVYKAVYKGEKVAVKVRHPGVEKYIQRDINLMFFFSRLLSKFSSAFRLPVTEDSMKKTLIDQIDFNNEKDNLLIFNEMFKGNKSIKFPLPFIEDTNHSVLVQSFVDGVPITYFETNRHPLNSVIARLGATTFFEMLMKNNFIHADCHGGNILVKISEKSSTALTEAMDYVRDKFSQLEEFFIQSTLKSETLKNLYTESKKEEDRVKKAIRECKEKVEITLIDAGMVIRLDESDRLNFINFLKSVLHGDGEKCAEMIFSISSFDGKKVIKGKFDQYMAELQSLFKELNGQGLDDLQGVRLLTGMLGIIREHNMKLEGEFATLLTNMLVLEGMAKDIDPQINILKCAVPYFKYAEPASKKSESVLQDF